MRGVDEGGLQGGQDPPHPRGHHEDCRGPHQDTLNSPRGPHKDALNSPREPSEDTLYLL